jgi:hypothetical protein
MLLDFGEVDAAPPRQPMIVAEDPDKIGQEHVVVLPDCLVIARRRSP